MSNQTSQHHTALGAIIWFTGLSGSGKSTLATNLDEILRKHGYSVKIVDGDLVRKEMHTNLGFTPADIIENNRRIIQYCQKYQNTLDIQLVTVIAPFKNTRQEAREILKNHYLEIYVNASLNTCQLRDTKGLYQKVQQNEITHMIGIDPTVPYQVPDNADIIADTESLSPNETINIITPKILSFLRQLLNEKT